MSIKLTCTFAALRHRQLISGAVQRKKKEMPKKIIVFVCVLFVMGAVDAFAESPQEASSTILKLLKDKNYSDLFQQRFTEWYKAEAEGIETQTAIKKLTPRWEKNHGIMVNLFEQLSQSEFTLTKDEKYLKTETGDVATAKVTIQGKEIPYRLYKMKNGLWGFRM